MDLGLAFEDEDLECNEKDMTGDRHLPYNVKICTNQWFHDALQSYPEDYMPGDDHEQFHSTLKFCADFDYHKKDYQAAAKIYKRLLDTVPPSYNCHDAQEALSRCYAYMGETEKSLQIAKEMVEASSKEDEARQRHALTLLSFVCEKAKKWTECVDALERLCEMQPQFPQTFHKLGDVYNRILEKDADDSQTSEDILRVKQISSYLRAKFLFLSVMEYTSQLIQDRNDKLVIELTSKVDDLPMSDSRKKFALEFIQREIERQSTNIKDFSSNQERLSTTSESALGTFYGKFCSWNACSER